MQYHPNGNNRDRTSARRRDLARLRKFIQARTTIEILPYTKTAGTAIGFAAGEEGSDESCLFNHKPAEHLQLPIRDWPWRRFGGTTHNYFHVY
jgi:hypothetical protein